MTMAYRHAMCIEDSNLLCGLLATLNPLTPSFHRIRGQFNVTDPEFGEITQNNGHCAI